MAKKMLKDPVCGIAVVRSKAKFEKLHGQTYGFCSEGCLERFRADPEAYTSSST